MTDKQIIDLTEIDKKYKDKCSLIKAGKCKNVNIFIEQSRKLKAKEQECESWKVLINEAQIEQRKLAQELEAYKMEAEEGREINAELKAENEELKKQLESTKGLAKIRYQCLEAVKELAKNANLPNISLYIDSFFK